MIKQFRLPDPPPELRDRILKDADDEPEDISPSTMNDARGRQLGPVLVVAACILLAGVLWMVVATAFNHTSAPIEPEHSLTNPELSDPASNRQQDSKKQSPPKKPSDEAKEKLIRNISDVADNLGRTGSGISPPDAVNCKIRKIGDGSQFLVEVKLLAGEKVIQEPTLAMEQKKWGTIFTGGKMTAWDFVLEKDDVPTIREVQVIGSGWACFLRCEDGKEGKISVNLQSYYFSNSAMTWSLKEDFQVDSGEERVLRKRVTLNCRDEDVRAVIKGIEELAGARIVVSPEVKGTITISINNVPWDEALSAIAKTLGFLMVFDKDGTARVGPPNKEKQ